MMTKNELKRYFGLKNDNDKLEFSQLSKGIKRDLKHALSLLNSVKGDIDEVSRLLSSLENVL